MIGTEVGFGTFMVADNFKAHRLEMGPKLGASQASGVSGLARRFGADNQAERVEAARARMRVEIEARRPGGTHGSAELDADAEKLRALGADAGLTLEDLGERVVAERGTVGEVGGIEAGAREFVDSVLPDAAPSVRAEVAGKVGRRMAKAVGAVKRGRPKVEGVRPWAAAGVSRTEWYRRRKKEGGG